MQCSYQQLTSVWIVLSIFSFNCKMNHCNIEPLNLFKVSKTHISMWNRNWQNEKQNEWKHHKLKTKIYSTPSDYRWFDLLKCFREKNTLFLPSYSYVMQRKLFQACTITVLEYIVLLLAWCLNLDSNCTVLI